jgi:hypothetical protein
MAEILVKAIDATNPDSVKDERGCYKRGYPVCVMPDGHSWGTQENLPTFVVVKLPGVSVDDIKQYIEPWKKQLSFNINSSNLVTDTFNLTITATKVNNTNNKGKITKAEVETFINNWNGVVTGFGNNSVSFDIVIFDAIKSKSFWNNINVNNIVFSEISYTQGGGIHRVQADYSAMNVNANGVEHLVTIKGGSIVSHDTLNKIVIFDITRQDVRTAFENHIKSKLENVIVRRQFYISSSFMNTVESANGTYTTDLATLQSNILNKLND